MGAPIPKPDETGQNSHPLEIAGILRRYLPGFLKHHRITAKQFRVLRAIVSCRTGALGGHMQSCESCGFEQPVYNSCGDRHCPKCQNASRNRWLKKRLEELLPVHHFHVVFTIPHLFNPLVRHNRKLFYDLLFKASAKTLQKFAQDPKHLGAQLGFIGVLHTWGQTLMLHPHIHFLVPAGGLSKDRQHWLDHRGHGKYLFYCPALAIVFRGAFIHLLKKAYNAGCLEIPKSMNLSDHRAFELFLDQCVNRKWNVYTKPPFAGPEEVVLYIGRYTHKTAINNSRLLSIEEGSVTFAYKDYREKGRRRKTKHMSLQADLFIARYLDHILPHHYHKIRFFGFMANGKRAKSLAAARRDIVRQDISMELNEAFIARFMSTLELNMAACPRCQHGTMTITGRIEASGYVSIFALDSG